MWLPPDCCSMNVTLSYCLVEEALAWQYLALGALLASMAWPQPALLYCSYCLAPRMNLSPTSQR